MNFPLGSEIRQSCEPFQAILVFFSNESDSCRGLCKRQEPLKRCGSLSFSSHSFFNSCANVTPSENRNKMTIYTGILGSTLPFT
jgi:hypothetical protein